jgi:hypothetical protein
MKTVAMRLAGVLVAILVVFGPARGEDFPVGEGGVGRTPCVGDCNGDGRVTIGELISGVLISLGTAPLARCPAFDESGNGIVSIAELITAVNNALDGCGRRGCLDSGGEVGRAMCCIGVGDFPDTCAIGACSCAPMDSEEVEVCDCGPDMCFDGTRCVAMDPETGCLDSGGEVALAMCCIGVGDFPDTCAIGACSCAPMDSEEVQVCDCGTEMCFDGAVCVEASGFSGVN